MYYIELCLKNDRKLRSRFYAEENDAENIFKKLAESHANKEVRAVVIETAYGNFVSKNCDDIDSITMKEQ